MILDDLFLSIPDSELELKNSLATWIVDWKINGENLNQLVSLVDRWFGMVWFKNEPDSDEFYANWVRFRTSYIEQPNALSMHERLSAFGLLEIWNAADDRGKACIALKLRGQNSLYDF